MKSIYTLLASKGTVLTVLCLCLVLALMPSCGEDEDGSTAIPDIQVAFSFTPENPEAGEEVTFTNASNGGTTLAWEFGDGGTATEADPKYTFEESGEFTVTLTVDGIEELVASKSIVVGAPVPILTFSPEEIEVGSAITFAVEVYNPNSESVTYAWDFGANATGDDLTEGKSTAASPVVVFSAAGDLTVSLTTMVGTVEASVTKDISIKAQLAKTLIFSVIDYAAKSGTIYGKKLFTGGIDEAAADMNIPTGAHPLTLRIDDNKVYVFDAGLGIKFTVDEAAADGAIYSADLDDPTQYVSIMNFAGGSGDYSTDPFFGDITSNKIYFGDRRNGVTAIDLSTANATYTTAEYPYFVKNNELGYYSSNAPAGEPTFGWGALNGSFYVKDNAGTEEFWWAKNSNHKGLWRFEADDIVVQEGDPLPGADLPDNGGLLTTEAVRAFELDETNQKVYFSINKVNSENPIGFYRADMDGSKIELIDDSRLHSEGGDAELTGITGIAVDAEGGYVYWGYRAPDNADPETAPLEVSGVKRWKIDGSGDVEIFVKDVWVYGLAIDNVKK